MRRDKVLRGRLKKWGLDNKNRRSVTQSTPRPSTKSHVNQNTTSARASGQSFRVDLESFTRYPESSERHTSEESFADDRDNRSSPLSPLSASDSLPRTSLNLLPELGIEVTARRLIHEVGNWYDYLSSQDHQPSMVSNAERAIINDFYYKMNCGLKVICHDNSPGWGLLYEQGCRVHAALQSRHPSNLIWLLKSLIDWQADVQKADWLSQPVMRVSTLLKRLASDVLDSRHPIRLLLDAFLDDHLSHSLCDILFKAVEHHYSRKVAPSGTHSSVADISLAHGRILVSQGRHEDVEAWFEKFSDQRSKWSLPLDAEIESFRILAKSRRYRGSYSQADSVLLKAWDMLVSRNSATSHAAFLVLQERAIVQRRMRDSKCCTTLLLQALEVAESPRFFDCGEVSYAVRLLHTVYREHGQLEDASQISVRYPALFGH